MTNLAHTASFHSNERITPSNRGIKHLEPDVPAGVLLTVGERNLCDLFVDSDCGNLSLRDFRGEAMLGSSARTSSTIAILAMLVSAGPARADDTAATGVAAALGLTASGGKTTIASGGGVSEAALLTSETFSEAGRVIAGLVRSKTLARPVFVLTHDQQLDLSTPHYVAGRIAALQYALNNGECAGTTGTGPKDLGGAAPKPAYADIGAALATDTSISSVPLTVDDRVLVTAIAMSERNAATHAQIAWKSSNAVANADSLPPPATAEAAPTPATTLHFLVPGDMLAIPSGSAVMSAFQKLLSTADDQRVCGATHPKAKSLLDTVDSFAKTATAAPDKGGPSLLGIAAELEASATGDSNILRVAVEQSGGTSIARSNIWYALGFPNSAIVSASLIASFRLTDGGSGQVLVAGFVRCAVSPVNIKDVSGALSSTSTKPGRKKALVSCSYLA